MLRAPRPPIRRPAPRSSVRSAARGAARARARARARLDARALSDLFCSAAFLVGSLLFLSETWQAAGVWLFVAGSGAMLAGTLSRILSGEDR